MPKFETSILLLAASVRSDRSWPEHSLRRTSELIQLLEDAIWDFPDQDRSLVELNLAKAREVLELRNLIVHGRWTLVDAERGLYEVEKILTRSAARRALGRDHWSDGEHPALVMPMNAATVARTWRLTRNVTLYLEESLDRWEQHFDHTAGPDAGN